VEHSIDRLMTAAGKYDLRISLLPLTLVSKPSAKNTIFLVHGQPDTQQAELVNESIRQIADATKAVDAVMLGVIGIRANGTCFNVLDKTNHPKSDTTSLQSFNVMILIGNFVHLADHILYQMIDKAMDQGFTEVIISLVSVDCVDSRL